MQAPVYLAADCNLSDNGRHLLLSADNRTKSSYDDRNFAAAGPRLQWNRLPLNMWHYDVSYEQGHSIKYSMV